MMFSSRIFASSVGLASVLSCATTGIAQSSKVNDTVGTTQQAPASDTSGPTVVQSGRGASPSPGLARSEATSAAAPLNASSSSAPSDSSGTVPDAAPGQATPTTTAQPPSDLAYLPAQPSPTGGALARRLSAEAQPVAPLEERLGRTHNGFYLRLSLGMGTGTVDFSDAPPQIGNAIEGAGWLDFRMGGTPSRGLVVGGGLWAGGFDTNEWRGAHSNRGSVGMAALGPFIDYFPDPNEGFHFGGTVGLGVIGVNADAFGDDHQREATGGAHGAWIGYDFWVSREWSLGVEARYAGIRAKNPDSDWKGSADTFGLAFTGLYH